MLSQPSVFTETRARHIRHFLKLLWQSPKGLSRAELSRRLFLSRPAISNITQQLIDWGMVEEAETISSKGGRPGVQIRIVADAFQVLGIDVGSSHIQVQSMNLHSGVHSEVKIAFDCVNRPNDVLEKLIDIGKKVLHEYIPLLGIGLSVPCPINNQEINTDILPKWKGVPILQTLKDEFNVPVFIENDANLGALSELWWGKGRDLDSLLFIKLGTGIGSGIVSERRLIRGAEGFAGEIGHIFLKGETKCRCGRLGCLEAYVGKPAIRERIELLSKGHPNEESCMPLVLKEVAKDLSSAIITLLNVINPQGIILWGDIVQEEPSFISILRTEITSSTKWAGIDPTLICASSYSAAVAIGACTLVLEEALEEPALFIQHPKI